MSWRDIVGVNLQIDISDRGGLDVGNTIEIAWLIHSVHHIRLPKLPNLFNREAIDTKDRQTRDRMVVQMPLPSQNDPASDSDCFESGSVPTTRLGQPYLAVPCRPSRIDSAYAVQDRAGQLIAEVLGAVGLTSTKKPCVGQSAVTFYRHGEYFSPNSCTIQILLHPQCQPRRQGRGYPSAAVSKTGWLLNTTLHQWTWHRNHPNCLIEWLWNAQLIYVSNSYSCHQLWRSCSAIELPESLCLPTNSFPLCIGFETAERESILPELNNVPVIN